MKRCLAGCGRNYTATPVCASPPRRLAQQVTSLSPPELPQWAQCYRLHHTAALRASAPCQQTVFQRRMIHSTVWNQQAEPYAQQADEEQHVELDNSHPASASTSDLESFDPMGEIMAADPNRPPTIEDLQSLKPRTRPVSSLQQMSPDGRLRHQTKLFKTAQQTLHQSFTVVQLRSLAKEAGLKDLKKKAKKADLIKRFVKDMWNIDDPKEIQARQAKAKASSEAASTRLAYTLSPIEWLLLSMHAATRKSIEKARAVTIRLANSETGSIEIHGSEDDIKLAQEDLTTFGSSLHSLRASLLSPSDGVDVQIPVESLRRIMEKSTCLAVPIASDSINPDGPSTFDYEVIGRSRDACEYAAMLLSSVWMQKCHRPEAKLLVFGKEKLIDSEAAPVLHHMAPMLLPTTVAPETALELLPAKSTTIASGLNWSQLYFRAVQSKSRVDESAFYFVAPPLDKKRIMTMIDGIEQQSQLQTIAQDATEETVWSSSLEQGQRRRYLATFGHVLYSLGTTDSAAVPAVEDADPSQDELATFDSSSSRPLIELIGRAAQADKSRHFVPALPAGFLRKHSFVSMGPQIESDQSPVPRDLVRLTYADTGSKGAELVIELVEADTEEVAGQQQPAISPLFGLLDEGSTKTPEEILGQEEKVESSTDSSSPKKRWRVESAVWRRVTSQTDVLIPESAVDLRLPELVESDLTDTDALETQLADFAQALLDRVGNDGSSDALPSPIAEVVRGEAEAEDTERRVMPPRMLSVDSPDNIETAYSLVSFQRVLQKRWQLRRDAAKSGPTLDPREAGFLLPQKDATEEVVDEEHDRAMIHEQIVDVGEPYARSTVSVEWVPRAEFDDHAQASPLEMEASRPSSLTWLKMRKALDPWLEAKHLPLAPARSTL